MRDHTALRHQGERMTPTEGAGSKYDKPQELSIVSIEVYRISTSQSGGESK